MTRAPGGTRDRLLDAFEALLVASGPRSTTLEAVAAEAGVSKGGLLYHFGSKDALVDGLLERLHGLSALDLERMRTAPEGAARYYVRTSVMEDVAFSRNIVAVLRMAQEGDPRAVGAYSAISDAWRAAIEEQVGDPVLARVVQLVGDGLWSASSLGIAAPDVDAVVERVDQLVAASRDGAARTTRSADHPGSGGGRHTS